MLKNIIGVIISFAYFFIIVLLPRVLLKKRNEFARKFVHIMIGNWWFILLIFFTNALCALIVPITFVFVNYISIKRESPNGLLAIYERKDNTTKSYGIILYPISLVVMVIISYIFTNEHYLGGIGIIPLAYGDGFAALVGKKYPWGEYQIGRVKKTLSGSLAMLIISIIILSIYILIVTDISFTKSLYVIIPTAVLSTVVEAITPNGFDNLTIPLISTFAFMFFMKII